ncbi:MAG: response regulator [Rhodospirillales bacterium]|nr:response regulator [Rhodospirillales bacterium]MDH3912441.1 response regulator [Rhodospirillales bacterium]MDH3967689.1 response regulator [Rhodospirillales bacterium]
MADSLKICVVDDDRDVAEGLAEILQMVGHQVQTVFAGQDAVRVLGQEDFDIAFINAELPDLTDLESFIEVRKIKPDMQTVMMTGYTIEQLLRQAVGSGSVNVLQKPVTMDEVVRALDGAKPKGIVLVAEDDPEIGDKIRDTLVLQEYRVKLAHTPKVALESVGAGDCDILVLDLRRPVIDALEVYLELEKQDHGLPTIVVSTYPDKQAGPIDVLRDQSVTGILIKPFDPARLLAVLEELCKKDTPAPVEKETQEAVRAETRGGRILVIDDDKDVAEGMADVLSDLGHTVEIALTGSKALEIAERFDAQIALVDIKLGRTSGLELIASLEKLRPGIVNVVITANAGKESVIASLRSGAFDFLNKPTHPRDLFAVLDRCFQKINAEKNKKSGIPTGESSPGLSASVGHELRDPLNAVIGFSEILGDEMLGPLGSEQYVHYAKGINEAGQHLTTVIDDLFEDSQAASGMTEPGGTQPDAPSSKDTEPEQSESDQTVEELSNELEPDETENVEPHSYEPQSSELEPGMPDFPDPFGDEEEAQAAASGEPDYIAAEAEGPAAAEMETAEPPASGSSLSELYSDQPDIAALFAEGPEAREADPADPGPARPGGPEPDGGQPDPLEPQLQDSDLSGISADEPWQETEDLDDLLSSTLDSLGADLRDPAPTDPNWTEPYSPEVEQTDPEWSEPEPYAPRDDEIGQDPPLADQSETYDAAVAGPDPAGPEAHDPSPSEAAWDEPATDRPEMQDPVLDEPGAHDRDKDEEDEKDEEAEDGNPTEIQAGNGRKILRFGPFKKVI